MLSLFLFSLQFACQHGLALSTTTNIFVKQIDNDLVEANIVGRAFYTLATNCTYYASLRAIPVLFGVQKCIQVDSQIAVLGYVLTYEGYTTQETAE